MPRRRNKNLIILRGLPGVGKTARARDILYGYEQRENKIGMSFSTDVYHEQTNFNRAVFHDNHSQNRMDVLHAMQNKVDPIIIDNINIYLWEMWPYVRMGFRRGYFISIEVIPEGFPDQCCDINELYWRCGGSISERKFWEWIATYQRADGFRDILYDKDCINRWRNRSEFRMNHW